MKRLDFETLFRIVRWDYNRCFKNESLDKDLFVEKYGRVMGEHYYNKFIHEFDGSCSKVRSPDSFTEQNVFDFTHLTFSRWNLISKTSFTQPSCPKQGTE